MVRRLKIKWLLLPVFFVIVLFAAKSGLIVQEQGDKALSNEAAVSITTSKVSYMNKTPKMSLTGSLEGITSAVISAKVGGRVANVFVDNGQQVQVGQTLFSLETTEANNGVQMAVNALRSAKANCDNIMADYTRYQTLFAQNAISRQQLDAYETKVKVAQADLANAYASLNNAQQQLNYGTVAAPVSGVAANKNVTIGQVISPGMTVMTVEDISRVYAVVNIEQKDIGTVKPGLSSEVTIDAFPGEKFKGQVDIINPVAGMGNRMFNTKIKIDNPDHKLKPGMFVKVDLITGPEAKVLTVPQAAIFQKQGLYYVYVVNDNKVTKTQAEVGDIIDDQIEIKSGVPEKAIVAISNVTKLKDGDTILVAE